VEKGSALPSAAVEVTGDRISQVGPLPDGLPAGELLDLGGRYLLPGLISCHTHLSVVYPFDATDEQESPGLSVLRAASRAADALRA
jgi:imidazolonepropionase-like amidohydrolase